MHEGTSSGVNANAEANGDHLWNMYRVSSSSRALLHWTNAIVSDALQETAVADTTFRNVAILVPGS